MHLAENLALERAQELINRVKAAASQIVVVIVSDTAKDLEKRPALKATGFIERMIGDARLSEVVSEFHRHGIASRVVYGFEAFASEAVAETLFPRECQVSTSLKMKG